jgi:hypothetical protein
MYTSVARWYIFKAKSQFGSILKGLKMENVGILYGCLDYFTAILYILLPFGNLEVIWYIFPRFGIFCEQKSGNPDLHPIMVDDQNFFKRFT